MGRATLSGLGRQGFKFLPVGLLHPRRHSPAGELLREQFSHLRRLVRVVELIATGAPADETQQNPLRVARRTAVLECKIAARRRSGVEMLMIDGARRNN